MSKQTYEQIRQEFLDEISKIKGVSYYIDSRDADPYSLRSDLTSALNTMFDKSIEYALKKFDDVVTDKQRQLELGELADKFFQRVKIND